MRNSTRGGRRRINWTLAVIVMVLLVLVALYFRSDDQPRGVVEPAAEVGE